MTLPNLSLELCNLVTKYQCYSHHHYGRRYTLQLGHMIRTYLLLRPQKFQQWVFGEVLPAIRETGSYSTDRQSIKPDYAAIKEEYTLASFLITDTFAGVELKPELVAGLKLNAAISIAPRLAPVLAESRQYLITNTAQECELLTVTEIGKRLDGISARKVNQMLIDQGFQIKNPNKKSSKDPSYVATNRGSEFSDLTLATGSKGSGTFQQLRWYSSVLSQLS